MPTIPIEVSEPAIAILTKLAEIKKVTLVELTQSEFAWVEKLSKDTQERIQDHYAYETKRQKEREANAYYKKHTWHEYRIKVFDNKKEILIGWWDCPLVVRGDYPDKQLVANEGKYYLKITEGTRNSIGSLGSMLMVSDTQYEFYPTLKRLKKAINRWFEQYGHSPYYK